MGEGVTVVFGGGGVWGIGWLSGLVAGLARAGVDLSRADRFIGTSAGSVLAAQLAVGWSPAALYERQVDPAKQTPELVPDPSKLSAIMALAGLYADGTPRPMVLGIAACALGALGLTLWVLRPRSLPDGSGSR